MLGEPTSIRNSAGWPSGVRFFGVLPRSRKSHELLPLDAGLGHGGHIGQLRGAHRVGGRQRAQLAFADESERGGRRYSLALQIDSTSMRKT